MWDEIVQEINRKFATKRIGNKCQKKIKYLIEKYKNAKDWNCKQTGGHRRHPDFYEEIDAVLGCRDVVTLPNVAEAGSSASISAATPTESQEWSPEARTERKRKRKRARTEEQDEEERDLLKSSLTGLETQRKDMNAFMESHKSARTISEYYECTGRSPD